ncbi:unnamed protein product [Pedinophyceae sp. YPF-701]|nr:unnamed protein product [Pedinophyceae sp. YPF-701]
MPWAVWWFFAVCLAAAQGLSTDYVAARQGDSVACQRFLAGGGITDLADTPDGLSWDPTGTLESWRRQNLEDVGVILHGRYAPVSGPTLRKSELDVRLEQLDAQLLQAAPACGPRCQAEQRQALVAFYAAAGGPTWEDVTARRVWNSSLHHCCWPGVLCCTAEHAIAIEAFDQAGQLLGATNFGAAASAGCVRPGGVVSVFLAPPNAIGSASATDADASMIQMQPRTLPDGFFSSALRTSLEYFDVARMGLSGTVPADIVSAVLLRTLDLASNALSGELVDAAPGGVPAPGAYGWGLLALLERLDLSNNRLSGRFPASLASLPRMRDLVVRGNPFTSLPSLFGCTQLPNLRRADLTGLTLADDVFKDSCAALRDPDIGPDVFLSPRPVPAMDSRAINGLSLRAAGLTARLHDTLVCRNAYQRLDLAENPGLTGSIPWCLPLVPGLRDLRLNNAGLEGDLPESTFASDLQILDVTNNRALSGRLPRRLAENFGRRPRLDNLAVFLAANTSMFDALPEDLDRVLSLSRLDVGDTLMSHDRSRPNSRGELLPEYLTFDYSGPRSVRAVRVRGADATDETVPTCRAVIWHPAAVSEGHLFVPAARVSPFYHHFTECGCTSDHELTWQDPSPDELALFNHARSSPLYPPPGPERDAFEAVHIPRYPVCVHVGDPSIKPEAVAGISVAAVVTLVLLAAVVLLFVYRRQLYTALLMARKRAGPPRSGEVTMVVTDVMSSTLCWEASPVAMSHANILHDEIVRQTAKHCFGYEVTTEGDSFTLVFHEPSDAIAFCLQAQVALASADWPPQLLEVLPKDNVRADLFQGLLVRLGVATGHAERIYTHSVTRRMQYEGGVAARALAISEITEGGQILIDERTLEVAQNNARWGELASEAARAMTSDSADNTREHDCVPPGSAPGRTLLSPAETGNANIFLLGPRDAPTVLDMGERVLEKGKAHLYQILVPGLENRATCFPAVSRDPLLLPGFLDAPGARHEGLSLDPLGTLDSAAATDQPPLPPVTIAFCAPGNTGTLAKDVGQRTFDAAIALYNTAVRRNLLRYRGYECQELSGTFMCAFESLADAHLWAVAVQKTMRELAWPRRLVANPATATGLVVRVGIYEGVPVSIVPHRSTGRADYFGPLVNRAARMCFSAAAPGQIVAPVDQTVRALIDLAGRERRDGSGGQEVAVALEHVSTNTEVLQLLPLETAAALARCAKAPADLLAELPKSMRALHAAAAQEANSGRFRLKGIQGEFELACMTIVDEGGSTGPADTPAPTIKARKKGAQLAEGRGLVATAHLVMAYPTCGRRTVAFDVRDSDNVSPAPSGFPQGQAAAQLGAAPADGRRAVTGGANEGRKALPAQADAHDQV